MPPRKDLTGNRYGKLTVIRSIGKSKKGSYLWECFCECGNKTVTRVDSLKNGHTKSCGKCPTNAFYQENDYMVGLTSNGERFIFDIDDFELVSKHNWAIGGRGYLSSRINGKSIKMHRLIMGFPNYQLDHRDTLKTNNRRNNLRRCTQTENNYNKEKFRGFTSRFKGVSWKQQIKKWCSRISHNKNQIYLGVFNSEIEAALAYNEAALRLHGEFARLNEVAV